MATDDFFRARLDHMIDLRHPLAVLANRMPWAQIESALAPAFARKNRRGQAVAGSDLFGTSLQIAGAGLSAAGRPRLPIRLMAALLYLKHAFNLSDEELVARWSENVVWVRRETGKVQVVKVHYDEGVANHIGPEPCVVVREGGCEASVGVHVGQPLSHEIVQIPDADVLHTAEGNTYGRALASARRSGVVEDPGMHVSALRGNREISRLACCRTGQVRFGKARSRSR